MSNAISPRTILCRAFPGIQDSVAEEMIANGRLLEYPAGTMLCREGDIGTTFYIILEGQVKATKVINDAEQRILKQLDAGDFFGEMALLHDAPRAATITTTAPTRLLEINKESFARLLERSTSVSMAIVREVSRRLRENDEMAIEDLRMKAHELADAYQQLAEQEYARREFLTTIAHELRTPLTAVNGFLQLIRLGNLEGETLQGALETVTRNVQDIISLTNDILFLQEMDLILPEFQSTNLAVVVARAVEQHRVYADRSGVNLRLRLVQDLPPILADPKSLGRAITAILDNAIKFSPGGGDVHIEVGHDGKILWVKVQDYGVGIPPAAMSRVFQRYFHLDQVNGHLFRGLGLGLSIAREVILKHGGEITAQSELGKGSIFTILLKASEA